MSRSWYPNWRRRAGAGLLALCLITALTGAAQAADPFRVTTDWGSGFTGEFTVTNTSGAAVEGWTVEFDFAHNITNIWCAKVLSHVGNHYVIGAEHWNGKLAAGASTTFGFNGSPGNVAAGPTNVVFKPVGGTNNPPAAKADSATTDQGKAVAIDVLSNDSDPDGDALSITGVTSPAHGAASVSGTSWATKSANGSRWTPRAFAD